MSNGDASATWQAARLALLAVTMSKIGHDLRGALSPAMLTAERLKANENAAVQRAADIILRSVERASEMVRVAVEIAREDPAVRARHFVPLQDLLTAPSTEGLPELSADVPDGALAELPSSLAEQALLHLRRAAAERGAKHVIASVLPDGRAWAITLTDDAVAPPPRTQAPPFRPDVSGLDLAAANALVRACGGELSVTEGAVGTPQFQLRLPMGRPVAHR